MFFYDLHIHSNSSPDSDSDLERIVRIAKKRGLDGIAIADHDSLYTGPTNIDGLTIIPGEEITLKDDSHLLAYFITKQIKGGEYTLEEAVKEIHRQGGYSVVAHPYREGQGMFKLPEFKKKIDLIDGIELYNSKDYDNVKRKTLSLCRKMKNKGIIFTAGSDAHNVDDIGCVSVCVDEPITRENFKEKLKELNFVINPEIIKANRYPYFRKLSIALGKKIGLYYNERIRHIISNIFFKKDKSNK